MNVGVAYQEFLSVKVARDGIAGGPGDFDVCILDGELFAIDDGDVAIERQCARACDGG